MSDRYKKTTLMEFDDEARAREGLRGRSQASGRKIRKLSPIGMRVVVALCKEPEMTETGLYLPEGAKQTMAESLLAEVIEVASAMDDHTDEEANISGVPLGALVLIRKETGVRVPWDDSLRLVDVKDILAIVNEMEVS